jgi:hypothetical protein
MGGCQYRWYWPVVLHTRLRCHPNSNDEAEQQLRKGSELDEDVRFVAGIWFLGKVYVASGKRDLSVRELGKAVKNLRGSAWTRCMLGHAWGVFGEPAKAQEILADLQDWALSLC